jgi:hypothetical protein
MVYCLTKLIASLLRYGQKNSFRYICPLLFLPTFSRVGLRLHQIKPFHFLSHSQIVWNILGIFAICCPILECFWPLATLFDDDGTANRWKFVPPFNLDFAEFLWPKVGCEKGKSGRRWRQCFPAVEESGKKQQQ